MSQVNRNAIILAAGTSSRFVPLSFERPKGLLEVRGEVLIERQIRQLKKAGISDITVVTGYKSDMFDYLREKYDVDLVFNEDYARYNNISSLIRVTDRLKNTYICSSDNYFPENVFMSDPADSFYSSEYASGETAEYCMNADDSDYIRDVSIGGRDSWYMVGHVYFNEDFSRAFRDLMLKEYDKEDVKAGYWEDLYISHISELPPMKINRYGEGEIREFDTLEELRAFDASYKTDTRSALVRRIARRLECGEEKLLDFKKAPSMYDSSAFSFLKGEESYKYSPVSDLLIKL